MSTCSRPRSPVSWPRLVADESPHVMNVPIVKREADVEPVLLSRIDSARPATCMQTYVLHKGYKNTHSVAASGK